MVLQPSDRRETSHHSVKHRAYAIPNTGTLMGRPPLERPASRSRSSSQTRRRQEDRPRGRGPRSGVLVRGQGVHADRGNWTEVEIRPIAICEMEPSTQYAVQRDGDLPARCIRGWPSNRNRQAQRLGSHRRTSVTCCSHQLALVRPAPRLPDPRGRDPVHAAARTLPRRAVAPRGVAP